MSSDVGCVGKYSFLGDCFLEGIMDGELGEKEKSMSRLIIMIHTRQLSLSFTSNSAVPINTGSTNHDPTK